MLITIQDLDCSFFHALLRLQDIHTAVAVEIRVECRANTLRASELSFRQGMDPTVDTSCVVWVRRIWMPSVYPIILQTTKWIVNCRHFFSWFIDHHLSRSSFAHVFLRTQPLFRGSSTVF
jgi:hypothetical protein